jgi:ribonuclease J
MRHLKEHEKLCHELQIPKVIASGNGAMIRLAPDGPELIDQVPQGRLYLDGAILEPAGSSALRERRKIAAVGLIVTTIVLTDSGDILEDSMVRTYGMPDQIGLSGRTLSQALQEDLDDALENLTRRQSRSDADVEDLCRRVLRARLKTSWGKRPQLDIQIVRVED